MRKILLVVLFSIIGLAFLFSFLINLKPVQNFFVHQASTYLSRRLKTEVHVDHVDFRLFNKFLIDGVFIADENKDTLLYAGEMALNVRNLIFFKRITRLNYLGLKDVTVNLKRSYTDSVWNYQFILDNFSRQGKKEEKGTFPLLSLGKIDLENIKFNQTDAWWGENKRISANRIQIDSRSFRPDKNRLLIKDIKLDKPVFILEKYQGGEEDAEEEEDNPAPADTSSGLKWNKDNWDIRISDLELKDGTFSLIKEGHEVPERYFDPDHISFEKINGTFKNARFDQDSIIADIQLATTERGGAEVKKLTGRFKMSPVTIEVSKMDLWTNKGHLSDFFALQFKDFGDLRDFTTKVIMRGNFKEATVFSDDIGFFAPPLLDWKKEVKLNGLIYGPLDDLTGKDLIVESGRRSKLTGSFNMSGLPDVDNTFLEFQNMNLTTSGRDLQAFIPALRNNNGINLDALRYINFKGNYVGFLFDFVSFGSLSTNLGSLHTDVNFKFGDQNKIPSYSGRIASDGLNIGPLLHIKNLGNVAFNTEIKGAGFTMEDLNTNLNGHFDQLVFKDYPYRDIDVAGNFKNKFFDGNIEMSDTNAVFSFHGEMDFSDSLPVFHFDSDIDRLNLYALNLTKDSVAFSGKLDLNAVGNNPDNFLGNARLFDIDLSENGKKIAFDTLVIHSTLDEVNHKWLTIQGNEVNGFLHGNFQISTLPDLLAYFLHHYFPSKFKAPKMVPAGEEMTFSFQFGDVDKILTPFLPEITQLEEGSLKGRTNVNKDSIELSLSLDHLGYKDLIFNDLRIDMEGGEGQITSKNSINEVYLKDSLVLPETNFQTSSRKDTSFLTINTIGSGAFNKADLKAELVFLKDGFYTKILESALFLNNKDWNISPDNEAWFKKDDIRINNFRIFHNDQEILLTSSDDLSKKNTFLVRVKHLFIDDFTSIFLRDVSFDGVADGEFKVMDLLDKLNITGGVDIADFRVNEDSVGQVSASIDYNKDKASLDWKFVKKDDPESSFNLAGSLGLSENEELNGDFDFNNTSIAFLTPFISEIFNDVKGKVTGTVHLIGNRQKPDLTGSLKVNDIGLQVDYTKVRYLIKNGTINFSPGIIDVGSLQITDQEGRTGTITGSVRHKNLQDIAFDLHLNTPGLEMLNTTSKDNILYYGTAAGSGKMDFTGPLNNLLMVINVSPQDGTHIVLPLADEKDIGKHDFIIFKEYGKAIEPNGKEKQKTNFNVKLFADMNPQAQIDVIVDAESGDHITARGNGALQMNVGTNTGFQMYGNYAITEGSYVFSFKGILSRKFAIKEGSSIAWNGDPSDANINIDAVYRVPGGANLYNLVADDVGTTEGLTKEDRQLLRQRETIDVYLSLKNSLMHPDISYDIQIPEASISTSSLALTRLQQIRQNPDVLINQVAALLAAGQFIPITSGNSSANILKSSGLSSAGQWVSGQLTGIINNLFGQQLNELGVSFSLDYNAYSTLGNYGDLQRNDVQFNLSKGLFNNRVKLEAGPSINWGNSNTPEASRSSYFAGDFRLEYLITPSGRVRFLAFSRNDYNVLLNQNLTRAGIGISYNRSFDKLVELLRSKEENARLDSLERASFQILPSIDQAISAPIRKKEDNDSTNEKSEKGIKED